MKKKFLTGLLSVSMAAAMLTGCGGSKAPAEDKAQTEEADDTEEAAEAEEAGDDGEEASAENTRRSSSDSSTGPEHPQELTASTRHCLHIPRKRLDWMWSFRLSIPQHTGMT